MADLIEHFEVESEELYSDATFDDKCQIIIPEFQAIYEELIQHFAYHPEDLHNLEWRKFERLLDAIFKNQGFVSEIGPGSGDSGVDLRLIQKANVGELVTLVQAKRYAPKYPIQLEPVAALLGVMYDQNADRGLFVTTSCYLPSAKKFAERQKKLLTLAASEDVGKWCREIVVARAHRGKGC